MKGSWTTVKRSSRARPARTLSTSGLVTAGLLAATKSARIGGSRNSSSASPRRRWLTMRGDAERQGSVGADADRQMQIGAGRRARAAGLDDDELDACLAHLFDQRPEMHVGGDEIGAPRDDEIAVDHRFGIGAADRADGVIPRRLAARVAYRAALQPRGAERMEEPVDEAAIHLPLMGGIGVAENGERAG